MANHTPKCKKCNAKGIRHLVHDSYYCPKCKRWLEVKCADPDCIFCKGRPEEPVKDN